MIRRKAHALAATAAPVLLALAAPALADERLVSHAYADNEVVRIDGRTGVQATIAFGKNEAIENVAVGNSQTWQITPNKRADLLFVKPLEPAARTNMTVVTNRHTYFFDLVASPKSRPLYMLRFTYKDEPVETAAPVPAALASLDSSERAIAEGDPLAMPSDAAALNFAWKSAGVAKLLPARVYDDGLSTYLLWPANTAVPAILVQDEKGDEGPVNYAVRGQTIVIGEVPRLIILRSGKSSATLENNRAAMPAAAPVPAAAAVAANTTVATPSAASSLGN
ncbi:type IV secretion system protein VirB9 [Novosphingobium sp. PhB165]|uniref:TrbG/VirB9 family P-type conjugative transfer protein n=1 Tax=Novosphingobium sp. PhB165 TaxID=2485105 RepID=UPI00104E97B1|nr:TrbG/VirB9 family P-type conjugative transfer protein [Novosphingobium sp. PhB165]TCM18046.1 type IV secretion system protein VirB9 [Novosphingobium sp. PhB165]